MKVLVVNGSPKGNKSDTLHITRSFLDGMDTYKKNVVTFFNVIEKNIGFCKGCFSCWKNGGKCVLNDDMDDFIKLLLSNEIVIFSFPLYCYGMPACLKNIIDRTLPLSTLKMKKIDNHYEHVSNRNVDYSKIRYVMISGCGFPSTENNFEPAILQFNRMFLRDDNTFVTIPESPMFNVPEADPVTKPMLSIVSKAGYEYAKFGFISDEVKNKLAIPMIPEDEYMEISNK